MSIDFDFCCLICLLENPTAVELSTSHGVGGCSCPISCSVVRRETASFVLLNRAPHSASAADSMTLRMMVDVLSMAPLLSMVGVGDALFPM